ncbi:MAG: hypothetical protein ACHQ17_06945 [Polyangia bacterium]
METMAQTSSSSITLASLIDGGAAQPALAAHLDALDPAARVREVEALSGATQKRLWEACAGAPAFTLDDLVPPSVGEGQTVIYAGKNSLAAFTHFEKRFQRRGGEIVGYNHQPMSFVTGPGYFTVVQSPEDPRELLFDYTRVPAEAPPGWPPVKSNRAGLSRFVYRDLHDFNRRVSRDVTIGSATRLGKVMDSYFVLARR